MTLEEMYEKLAHYNNVFYSSKYSLERKEMEIMEKNKGKEGLMNIFGEIKGGGMK